MLLHSGQKETPNHQQQKKEEEKNHPNKHTQKQPFQKNTTSSPLSPPQKKN